MTEHKLTLKDDDDGDLFGRFSWQADAIHDVLDAFEEWDVEGYYDADAQDAMHDRRTKALTALRESQEAFLLFWAECSCGWKSPRFESEAEAENAWQFHVEPEEQEAEA